MYHDLRFARDWPVWLGRTLVALALTAAAPQRAQVPPPSGDPRTVQASDDPLIAFVEAAPSADATAMVADALAASPSAHEALATAEEARQVAAEARAAGRPRVDADFTEQHVVSRGFSHDPGNLIERSRPGQRADISLSAEQLLWDFGATSARTRAAAYRADAERDRVDAVATDAAMQVIQAWCDLRAAEGVRDVAATLVARQQGLLDDTRERIRAGLGAPVDADRIRAALSAARAELARAAGEQASARARLVAGIGAATPASPSRLSPLVVVMPDASAAIAAAHELPEIHFANAGLAAAEQDRAALAADRLPRFTLGIDAAKYSAFDGVQDHDIRARVSLRHRFYAGGASGARAAGAAARVEAARFARDRILAEAIRDASSAWAESRARDDEVAARREAYLSERRARDAYAEEFRVARGSLLELLHAEADLFASAVAYLRAGPAADAARWTLLARTGQLFAVLDGVRRPPPSL